MAKKISLSSTRTFPLPRRIWSSIKLEMRRILLILLLWHDLSIMAFSSSLLVTLNWFNLFSSQSKTSGRYGKENVRWRNSADPHRVYYHSYLELTIFLHSWGNFWKAVVSLKIKIIFIFHALRFPSLFPDAILFAWAVPKSTFLNWKFYLHLMQFYMFQLAIKHLFSELSS